MDGEKRPDGGKNPSRNLLNLKGQCTNTKCKKTHEDRRVGLCDACLAEAAKARRRKRTLEYKAFATTHTVDGIRDIAAIIGEYPNKGRKKELGVARLGVKKKKTRSVERAENVSEQ